ncbi:LOW QUALITY PROTEIN: putative defensin-like protein 119 [Eutrema salsugineum]|uniref:LOW QUALITY PROTEIN: putative defensin-like protein 119 n=1 Tax=Eutrema salsugineum TaxID=72664 RepID=UPI000CED268C|nr:LOW QUALITY PROTEIN: putative defensin-like protein 119 [Eutrema salsugineum]
MTKATVFSIFLIILVLGMITKEIKGQEMCHDLLIKTDCEPAACTNLCTLKWKGNGACFQNVHVYSCLCTFPCQI